MKQFWYSIMLFVTPKNKVCLPAIEINDLKFIF
jgi:hypothetical protein